MARKMCAGCQQPGTNQRRVGPSGYHVDCNPGGLRANHAGPEEAEDAGELSEDAQLRAKIVSDVQALLPLVTRGVLSPAQFGLIVSDMPGCCDAFEKPGRA